MVSKKVGIIGAGLGGLSTAVRLAFKGLEVHVFEANGKAGGKAGQLEKEGFRFDTGPSLLTMPFVLDDLFKTAGRKLEDYLTIDKLNILCKYYFPDGTVLNAYADSEKFSSEIEAKTGDSGTSVYEYLRYAEKIFDLSADLFLNNSFSEVSTFLNRKAFKTLLQLNKLDTNRSMHEANNSFFKDPKTIQLFDRYATYNGSDPYKAPATLNIIQHVEYNLGGYIVKEGIYKIPEVLKEIAEEKGVNFHFNEKAEKILIENDKTSGIQSAKNQYHFDVVVSNADVDFTYKYLLNDNSSKPARRYDKLEKSSSALVFYWGIDREYNDLEIHNIFFSKDYKKEFVELFNEQVVPDDPTTYLYISSKYNNNDAPAGKENWFVMINVPRTEKRYDKSEIDLIRTNIQRKIDSALNTKISDHILFEEIMTPKDIDEKTNSPGGSIYGISSNNKMAAFLRQQNKSREYKGLYFCGGSAHPGGGIPLVLLSGKITAGLIFKYELK